MAQKTGAQPLDRLKTLRHDMAHQDSMILAARKAGASWEELMSATGYSRQTVATRLKRANGGSVPSVGRVDKD